MSMLQRPDLVLGAVGVFLVMAALVHLVLDRRRWLGKTETRSPGGFKPCLPGLLLRVLGTICLAAALAEGLPLVVHGVSGALSIFLAGCLVTGALIELATVLRWPLARHNCRASIAVGAGVVACGVAAMAGYWYVRSVPPGAVAVDWPVRGTWRVVAGGRCALTNYHHNSPATQNYAVDLMGAEGGETTEGQPVFAPVNGRASKVVADWQDGPNASADGNLVTLNVDGIEISFAHLQEGSVAVAQGETVREGSLLGRCGSTGSAVVPHLHIHAQRDGSAVPLVFGPDHTFPICGDVVVCRE